jgi:hypothetical protein
MKELAEEIDLRMYPETKRKRFKNLRLHGRPKDYVAVETQATR